MKFTTAQLENSLVGGHRRPPVLQVTFIRVDTISLSSSLPLPSLHPYLPWRSNRAGRRRKQEKETIYNSAFKDKDFIIVRKADFQQGISTLLFYAWKHRNSESHLYALYNYIQSLQCHTLLHTTEPSRVITPWPQPLFGTLEPPKGENNYPPRNNALPSNYYPDHARIMIFGSKEQGPSYSLQARISTALDSSEVKVLNIKTAWNLPESIRDAEKTVESHIAQACDSSLAGLAHNPFWTSLYAFLLVGPYFSLFAWKARPEEEQLLPLPPIPKVPHPGGKETKEELEELIAKREEVIRHRMERIRNTPVPEVIHYNEPVFNLTTQPYQKWYDKATLSATYLHALSLPTSAEEELARQPSWFGARDSNRFGESNRRVNIGQDIGHKFVQKMVIDDRIQNELASMNLVKDQPDPTLAGPRPPDSNDSQQSRFSETEPQIFDPDAGPHPMKTRASTQDVDDTDADLLC
ncbi:hypothetical protein GSI_08866 [Ganoderma sinense ZZ0214-1]|uniref:Uncharacterized protein n=1 Tax=Ganoderma sinense ZZ0214-1 TaxID=1077348 RepID=A0A2G8S4Z1_9APHY|nr:hypothetical protein GSI_08866 [Ganoderma sinense ZZ0214-1]